MSIVNAATPPDMVATIQFAEEALDAARRAKVSSQEVNRLQDWLNDQRVASLRRQQAIARNLVNAALKKISGSS